MQKSNDVNSTRHIVETHLPQTSIYEADASPQNVIDGTAGSFLKQDPVQSRCTVRLLRIPCPKAWLMACTTMPGISVAHLIGKDTLNPVRDVVGGQKLICE